LHEEYDPKRATACAELVDQIQNNSLMHRILFSGEATFRICGKTSRHNCRTWANEKPAELAEWKDTRLKRMCGLEWRNDATITGTVYFDMLEQFLEYQLFQDGILRFLNRWIGHGVPRPWAARSPDLTPLHIIAWYVIKSEAYRRNIRIYHSFEIALGSQFRK
jgi:hypothetical protein